MAIAVLATEEVRCHRWAVSEVLTLDLAMQMLTMLLHEASTAGHGYE